MSIYRREIDAQCCNQWMNGIRTINGQYPDDDRDLKIQAGTGVTITPVTAGIEISASLPAPPVPGPMTFRGTLGTGGTITSLPPATSANIGDVYVALESGTVPVTYETGDMVISNGITWVVIPSGDDPVDWSQILNTPDTIAGYGITDAYTKSEVDAAFVDLPNAQAITGVKTVPLEATGTFSDQIASSNKVKNELDNYAPMVRTTGNQIVMGTKDMSVGMNVTTILSTEADVHPYTWYRIAKLSPTRYYRFTYNISFPFNNASYMINDIVVITERVSNADKMSLASMSKISQNVQNTEYVGIACDGTDFWLFIKLAQYTHHTMIGTQCTAAGVLTNINGQVTPITPVIDDPTTYANYVII